MLNNTWLNWEKKTVTPTVNFFANLSIYVRTSQFNEFVKMFKPNSKTTVLDVGVTSDETLKDSNLFEKLYKWPKTLTITTIEDSKKIKARYPKTRVIKVAARRRLPFKSKKFDVVVSWATLEHVGSRDMQQDFINELLRVGRKIFITTPDRAALYEPHTGFFFLHWLPLAWFRKISKIAGRKFWSEEENLNPLYVSDLEKMHFNRKIKFKVFRLFNFLPSHIIIFS